METNNGKQAGGSGYEPAIEFALVKLNANDSPDTVRTVTMERFNLADFEIDEVMTQAINQYQHKEKNF